MKYKVTTTNKVLPDIDSLCAYLVSNHGKSCHPSELERITTICEQLDIIAIADTPVITPIVSVEERLKQIQQARKTWLEENIDADGIALALILHLQGNIIGMRMVEWSATLGKISSLRQAQLEQGIISWSDDLVDFSMYTKPHTVNEMMIAAGV